MIRSLWTAASGMQAQSTNIDVIANNLANVNTTSFKRSRADFQDLIYETMRAAGSTSADGSQLPTGIQIGHGTRPAAVQMNFSQGDFHHTHNDLDLAIEGGGFFQVTNTDGDTVYTRAGSFKVDGTGRVVTSDGFPIEPEIVIPLDATSINVGMDGTISVMQPGSTTATEVGTLTMARFINPAGLQAIGRNLYQTTDASGDAITGTAGQDGIGTLAQGYLEMSNVNVVDEMVNMISAQRAYEINSKSIRTADEMLQMANQLKR